MKRDYNPIWDRFVRGQPGNNLPSGHTSDYAIANLLDGLYARNATSGEAPVQEDDLVESLPGGGGAEVGRSRWRRRRTLEGKVGGKLHRKSLDGGAAEKQ
ncbi:unnamed protein product [Pylaiella littoralis]